MATPSLTKKDLFRALQVKVGLGTFIFPFLYDFSPHCLHLVGDPTSGRPRPDTTTRRSDTRPYGFWLMSMSESDNKLFWQPHEGKICVLFSLCHFGNRNSAQVWAWLGWWKKHRLTGVSLQRGFAQESLGEPSKLLSCSVWVTTSPSLETFMCSIQRKLDRAR